MVTNDVHLTGLMTVTEKETLDFYICDVGFFSSKDPTRATVDYQSPLFFMT